MKLSTNIAGLKRTAQPSCYEVKKQRASSGLPKPEAAKKTKTQFKTNIAERTSKCLSGMDGEAFPAEELLKRNLSWSDSDPDIPSPEQQQDRDELLLSGIKPKTANNNPTS